MPTGADHGWPVVYRAKSAGEFVIAVSLRPIGRALVTELFARLVTGGTGSAFVSAPG